MFICVCCMTKLGSPVERKNIPELCGILSRPVHTKPGQFQLNFQHLLIILDSKYKFRIQRPLCGIFITVCGALHGAQSCQMQKQFKFSKSPIHSFTFALSTKLIVN